MTNYNSIRTYKNLDQIDDAFAAGNITRAQMLRLHSMFVNRSSDRSIENAGILMSSESMSYGRDSRDSYERHGVSFRD